MAVWQRACDVEGLIGRDEFFPLEHTADELNLGQREMREVGQSTILDLSILTKALAEQIGRWRASVGYRGNVHADIISSTFMY